MDNLWRSGIVLETLARLRRARRASERVQARIHFFLQQKVRASPLSEEQVRQYHRDGYLLISGLVPREIADGAGAATWRSLGADAQVPATWENLGPRPHMLSDARVLDTYTDTMIAAAAQLAGEDVAGFCRPRYALTVNRLPTSGAWQPHEPHLDRTIAESRYRTFPRPYSIGSITYLTDVQSHGGGTMVWPGAHLKLETLARDNPGRYKYLAALNGDLGRVGLGHPVELMPSQGDVLYHHYLCVHASSENVSGVPRLAIFHKW